MPSGQPSWLFFQRFCNALVFLTRIPAPAWIDYSSELQSRSACYVPLVGILVGVIAASSYFLSALLLPVSVAVVISIAFTVWLTGAFHEDGFADVCDGFGGAWQAEKIKAIMKDSRLGTYGTVAIVLILLAKFVTLQEIAQEVEFAYFAAILIAAHAISRFSAISFLNTHRYASDDHRSKSGFITTTMTAKEFGFASLCGVLPLLFLAFVWTPWILLTLLVLWLVRAYLAALFQRYLGGYSGDCLGCVQQLSELAVYLAACALAYRGVAF